jgi:hypothetical protein
MMIDTLNWSPRFSTAPDDAHTTELAARMRGCTDLALSSGSAEDLARSAGFNYEVLPIGSGNSTVQSLLVPLRSGGFSVVINALHRRSEPEAQWLTAHEIAHSFFYAAGSPPRRIVRCSAQEESFCDAFADALLVDVAACRDLRVA